MKKQDKTININDFQYKSDIFHKSIKNKKKDFYASKAKETKIPQEWIDIHFKTYPRMKNIKMNIPKKITETEKLLLKRRSTQKMVKKPISKADLEHLLYYSFGKIDSPSGNINLSKRPYPSGGARYPLEIYILLLQGKGIKQGLYHYNVKENSLEILLESISLSNVKQLTGDTEWILASSAIIFITAIFDRNRIKYRDRGYVYTLIEAGHAAQNLCLLVTKLGLKINPLGGFVDDEVSKFLDIQNEKEYPIYGLVLGG